MKSLYDVLGARADDDAQAIKKAFRAAVKAHHPDLHPGDPNAALRFRRIVTANAILRDEKQRAAYDQMLALERERIESKNAAHQQLQLRHQRRKDRLKMGGFAAAGIGVLVGVLAMAYGLFMHASADATAIKSRPASAKPAASVETVMDGKTVAPAAPIVIASRSEAAPADVLVETAGDGADKARESAENPPAEKAGADANTPEPKTGAPAQADSAPDAVPAPDAAPPVADKGDAVALASRDPAPALPNDGAFYRELGRVSYRIGDFPHAIVNLDQAIRRNPNDAKSYHIRGNAWDDMGAFSKAVADYDEAIRLDPKNPFYLHDRAVMWHRRGELDKALSDLDRAIRLGAADPNIYCDRGLVWYQKGNRARAIADFSQAARLDGRFTAAYITRGLIVHPASEFNVAFSDFGRTIRVNPSVIEAARKAK